MVRLPGSFCLPCNLLLSNTSSALVALVLKQTSYSSLQRIPKILVSFNDFLASVSSQIIASELPRQEKDNQDRDDLCRNASIDARQIVGRVLTAKDQGTANPANATKSNKRGRAERPLPVPADIVC